MMGLREELAQPNQTKTSKVVSLTQRKLSGCPLQKGTMQLRMKKGSQQMMNTPAGQDGGQGAQRGRAGGKSGAEGARGGGGAGDLTGSLAAAPPRHQGAAQKPCLTLI